MIITKEWVIEYLNTKGTKFIIPREATRIEESAFSDIFGYGSERQDEPIEIIFEENSKLEEIEKYAFRMCNISNRVVVPRNVKKIGDMAFFACEQGAILQEGTKIEKRRSIYMCFL
ncbi:MAG: leucine-rich repeat protein [Clostridia bacterium]|nr:leucine-rich repeat protein [Clostridia bacterium]